MARTKLKGVGGGEWGGGEERGERRASFPRSAWERTGCDALRRPVRRGASEPAGSHAERGNQKAISPLPSPLSLLLLLLAVALLLSPTASSAGELLLADGGRSAYQIVVADDASPSTRHGAEELQTFLEQISGAKLPIVSDRQPQGTQEIILGDNAHLRTLGLSLDLPPLGPEGYVIRTVGDASGHRGRTTPREHVWRLWASRRPPWLPLVRAGREPHSQAAAAGRRRRSTTAKSRRSNTASRLSTSVSTAIGVRGTA